MLREVTLDDKYRLRTGIIYLTGSQALIRLAMNQLRRDEAAGHKTAAYITGYRGSPMHNIDKESWRATKELEANNVFFHPAVNEDLAATACWARSRRPCIQAANTTGLPPSGTARDRGSIAPSMRSGMRTWPAPQGSAVCWRPSVTTRQ